MMDVIFVLLALRLRFGYYCYYYYLCANLTVDRLNEVSCANQIISWDLFVSPRKVASDFRPLFWRLLAKVATRRTRKEKSGNKNLIYCKY